MIARLTSKGQMTLPKEIRDCLGLQAGDRLDVHIKDRSIVLTPKTLTIDDVCSILPKPPHAVSIEAMNESIAEAGSDLRE